MRNHPPPSPGFSDYNRAVLSKKSLALLAALIVWVTACSPSPEPQSAATPTLYLITATLPPTLTPRPSATPPPPTITATVAPVEGTTTTQVNVRAEPSTAANSLGMLAIFSKVLIVGKNAGGDWYLILYPDSTQGQGWVAAQYVQTQGQPDVPVIGGAPAGSPRAVVMQRLNVRSGPGTDYNSLGTLEPQTTVTLTGKDQSGAWLQIEYPGGPGGRGWITAAYVQAQGVESLPIVTETGQVVGTVTPGAGPPPPTPTVVPAPPDGDSAESPAVSVNFSPGTARSFNYSSDVSAPEGDAEDWVQFAPYGQSGQPVNVEVTLTCTGNSALSLELWQGGRALQRWDLTCGEIRRLILALFAGAPYSLRLFPPAPAAGLAYVNYSLTVTSNP